MIDLENQTSLHINIETLEKIASSLTTSEIELIIVDDSTMKTLNSQHRGKAQSTDVLSFPLETPFTQQPIFDMPLGSIVICEDYVHQKAKELKHSTEDETALLFIHGLLHLLGFNHEEDDGEMRKREKEIINTFDLPQSLIIRTGE